MNESARTITYVVVAAVAVGLAWTLSPPSEITPESLRVAQVGKPFFDDFNPGEATSIRVIGYDEAKATSRTFGVKFENGKWTIPSHHNYPADGADRLAKTGASARGIKREELASSSPQNHEQLGVIDPLDEDKTKLKGRGQRITLNKGDGVLVDLIIGKQAKDRPGFFYVRKPGEDATYVAKLSLELSTKFADWIETDLLKIDKNDLTELVVNDYKTDTAGGQLDILQGDVSTLTRDKSADPWKLEGLDDVHDELDVTKVNAMIGALDDLKLVGVRPKPKGFKPDLTIDREFVKQQVELQRLVMDMHARGYTLAQDRKKQLRLYADEGELTAATNKGVVYTLKFGSMFLGDEAEIEVGAAEESEKADKSVKEKEGDADADKSKSKAEEGKQRSRYLFVTADFDEKFLGSPPQKPKPPEEIASAAEGDAKPGQGAAKKDAAAADDADKKAAPESNTPESDTPESNTTDPKSSNKEEAGKDEAGDKKPNDEPKKSDAVEESCFPVSVLDDEPASPADDKEKSEQPADKPSEGDKPQDEKPEPATPAAESKSQPAPKEEKKKSAEELKQEYDTQVKKYESDLKAHQDKVAAGKKLVDELNARFGGWYYVISAENFNKLHLSRKELVKEKGKSADDKKAGTLPGTVDDGEPLDDEGKSAKDPADEPKADKVDADKSSPDKPEAVQPETDKPKDEKVEKNVDGKPAVKGPDAKGKGE